MTLPSNLKLYPALKGTNMIFSSKGLVNTDKVDRSRLSRFSGWISEKFGLSDEKDEVRGKIPSMLRQSIRLHEKKKPVKSLSQHKDFLEF